MRASRWFPTTTERTAARAAKDFAKADALRAELAAGSVEVLDTPGGVDWKVTE